MPFTMTMPKLSPTMEEGAIVKWHKKVGEFVEVGEVLIDVSTDKATVEHAVIDGGWLRKILVKEGEAAIVNQAIAVFTEEEKESIEGYVPEGIVSPPKKTEPAAAPSGPVEAGQVQQKAELQGGGLRQPAFVPEKPLESYAFEFPTEAVQTRVRASPLARRLAKERGLDLSTVKGSGPNQRVMSRDLSMAQPDTMTGFGRRALPSITPGAYEEETLSPMRKVIGQRLQESKTFIPHFYVTTQIDALPLVEAREQLMKIGVKITFNDFILKAAALSLRNHPEINSGFNSVNGTIIRFKTIDIAVAVSIDGGLITPIIRHADYKNLGEISVEVKQLVQKAKAGKLQPQEYKGGSFTVSNLGMYGVGEFIAVINPPQAAILAIGGILDQPVIKHGQIVPGKVMNLTVSADHRVVDGATVAQFLNNLKKHLENPAILIV
jgi:pyruvate dehydrogenase E2 component (dihydrolipoamide acetyltransferase)